MSGQRPVDNHGATAAPSPAWRALRVMAETFADYMAFRISATNRAERGGVPPEEFADLIEGLNRQEAALKRELRLRYEAAVPERIRQWQAEQRGLGEHTFARLLGILGDPRMAYPWHWEGTGSDRHLVQDPPYPRSISQLWSYCGLGDPERKRRRGMEVDEALACGSPRLRTLLFVIAERCMVAGSGPYRNVYDERRVVTIGREHAVPCVRCGPSGKPAEAGSRWSKAHQHHDALRIVAKEVLRDLWLVAGEGARRDAEPVVSAPLSATGLQPARPLQDSSPKEDE